MKFLTRIAAAFLCVASVMWAFAADAPVKREMRSAWVATVWRLDWPSQVISTTGNTSQINKQKSDLTRMLDSLSVNNMNAVNFQVRARADAFYKSSYEPWSSDLVASRGMDPGYDPLEYCVAECHRRGMECHAWVNPYRYESQLNQWDGTPQAYRADHPDWLLDVGDASILNPALPEVTQRICDIIAEIVTNYDIDGVLFDDYFYLSGTGNADATQYNAYKTAGGTLALADWRRENVNNMVAAVNRTIKAIKPWVRFGISPAGVSCTTSAHAAKYGISPCPNGSDWQYNDIYSDPIAWIYNHSLDFISPQIYWTIGNSTDYDPIAKWWSQIAAKFGRHFYSSHSISSLTGTSKAPSMSELESGLQLMATGPNSTTFEEYANQIRLNRQYTENDAPGSIFYSVKYMYSTAKLFAHYLRTQVFNTPALVPAMTWYPVTTPGYPENVTRNDGRLSWTGPDNVRFTVYAVPQSIDRQNFDREADYLLGVAYDKQFTIPTNRLTGYNYAVCVLDRYGNEYTPVFEGAATQTLAAPALTAPADGAAIEMPFNFSWQSVAGATSYIVEVGTDAAMTNLVASQAAGSTSLSTDDFSQQIPANTQLRWRVRACANSCRDGVSTPRSFTAKLLTITAPADLDTCVALRPVVRWSMPERAVTLQIADDPAFGDDAIVYASAATGGQHAVPAYVLKYYTQYYVRALYDHNGRQCQSPVVMFTTTEGIPSVPSLTFPQAGGTLHANEHLQLAAQEGVTGFRLEVSASTSFSSRSSYVQEKVGLTDFTDPKTGAEIKVSNKNLTDGKTYYVRARAKYNSPSGSATTDYCQPVAFTYSKNDASVTDITADTANASLQWADGILTVNAAGTARVEVYAADGTLIAVPLDTRAAHGTVAVPLALDARGVYIVTLNGANAIKIVR